MLEQNPKKEFVVNYTENQVREAVLKLNSTEPNYYVLVKDDKVLNEIRIHQKGQLLDVGYHIDFTLSKVSENETKVIVEVSRNLGTINTQGEVSIANNSLKSATAKFSAFLSGDIDTATGKPNIPQQGCMLVIVQLIAVSGGLIVLLLLLFMNSCNKLDEDGTPRDIHVTWDDTCVYHVPMAPQSGCKFPGQEFYVTIAKGQTFSIDVFSKNTCVMFPREFEVTVKNDKKVIYKSRSKEHKIKVNID